MSPTSAELRKRSALDPAYRPGFDRRLTRPEASGNLGAIQATAGLDSILCRVRSPGQRGSQQGRRSAGRTYSLARRPDDELARAWAAVGQGWANLSHAEAARDMAVAAFAVDQSGVNIYPARRCWCEGPSI